MDHKCMLQLSYGFSKEKKYISKSIDLFVIFEQMALKLLHEIQMEMVSLA